MPRNKWFVIGFISLFVLLTAIACGDRTQTRPVISQQSAELTNLESIEQLKAVFNEDAGNPQPLLLSGYTVIRERRALEEAFLMLLEESENGIETN